MPITENQVEQLLDSDDEPNVPLALDGSQKLQKYVPPEQARARRQAVSKMLQAGMSIDTIVEVMSKPAVIDKDGNIKPGFGIAETTTRRVIAQVYRTWESEDADRALHRKAAAVRRHHTHIQSAAKKGAWGAVAMLESNLMKLEGTSEPIEVNLNSPDARVSDALVRVLGGYDPQRLRELVASERAKVVDTSGESVSDESVPE